MAALVAVCLAAASTARRLAPRPTPVRLAALSSDNASRDVFLRGPLH
ncbi:MAG: hypothetical protein ABJB93_04210 [Gaiellales bacterium]